MTNLTIRNIPDDVIKKIKTLSEIERRSINSEILFIIERGLKKELLTKKNNIVSKEMQINIWEKLSGNWIDNRTTEKIIDDVYTGRTEGRKIEL